MRLVWALGVCFNLVLLIFSGFALLVSSWVAYRVLWLGSPPGTPLGLDMIAPTAGAASLQWFIAFALCALFAMGLRICLHRSVPKAFR